MIEDALTDCVRMGTRVSVHLVGAGAALSMLDCEILGSSQGGSNFDIVKRCGTEDPDIVLTFDAGAVSSLVQHKDGVLVKLRL